MLLLSDYTYFIELLKNSFTIYFDKMKQGNANRIYEDELQEIVFNHYHATETGINS